jgi:dTDP-4-dehydrorhamnose reductase
MMAAVSAWIWLRSSENMRVVVIGTSGQLARCLAEEQPHHIGAVFLGRDRLDLARPGDVSPTLAAERPDLIINAAAYTAVDKAETEPDLAFAINRDGPAALAAFCATRGVTLIHISTDYVFDGAKPVPYVEDDAPSPINVYGASKLAGEQAVRRTMAQRSLIVRTSWVYSAYGQNFFKTMFRLAGERDRLRVVDDQRGRPTSAHDLARALWAIALEAAAWTADAPQWGLYHYAGEGTATWADFAEAIFAQARPRLLRTPAIERIASSEYPTPATRPRNSILDCSKFQRVFALPPRPWRQSLSEVITHNLVGELQ